ncbi:MAG: hypothetical protein Q8L37_05535 [Candidatus Gottesmanbacteria bacterium]|nr:hypothetical protein [Candidatus Gottesmanbacteria bacterium]
MKKTFNKGVVYSFISIWIIGLLSMLSSYFSILIVATLVISLSSYNVIKKTGERGKWLSLITIAYSLLATCVFIISFMQSSGENVPIIGLLTLASLFVGMIISNQLQKTAV